LPESAQNDGELAAVISAWPGLPEAVRARIVGLVLSGEGLVEGATASVGQR